MPWSQQTPGFPPPAAQGIPGPFPQVAKRHWPPTQTAGLWQGT